MKQLFTLILFLSTVLPLTAQGEFNTFIDSALSIQDSVLRVAYVDSVLSAKQDSSTSVPFVEDDTAYFMYYDEADEVFIAGDFNGWSPDWQMNHMEYTNYFYYGHYFEPTARLDYKLVVDGSWILDPWNPNQVSGGFGPNSELAMPDYVQPWEIESYSETAKGTIESFTLNSPELSKNFSIQVYLPPGYDTTGASWYPVAYVHDGQEYISLGSMNNVIDNLIDSNKIDPVIGVFIRPGNRNDEYAFDDRFDYAEFVAKTVVNHIDENYFTIPDSSLRLTMGASFGGNISGLISHTYPEVFANSGWHSPALWPNDGEVAELYLEEVKDVKIYFNVGTYENLGVDWNLFSDSLTTLGYEYEWEELHEGHSWGFWRATTDDILNYFFPVGITPDKPEIPTSNSITSNQHIEQIRAYPNPFSYSTTIEFNAKTQGTYEFTLYNELGQLVVSKSIDILSTSTSKINVNGSDLDVGLYFYTIKGNSEVFTGKLIKR